MRVSQCSRCGLDHPHVEPLPLSRPFSPPEAAPVAWTHYFLCPANGQPVMVIYAGDGDSAPGASRVQRLVTARAYEHPSHLPQGGDVRVFAALAGRRFDGCLVLCTVADLLSGEFHDWLTNALRCRLPPNVNPRLEVLP